MWITAACQHLTRWLVEAQPAGCVDYYVADEQLELIEREEQTLRNNGTPLCLDLGCASIDEMFSALPSKMVVFGMMRCYHLIMSCRTADHNYL
jgi:hypothetical protein